MGLRRFLGWVGLLLACALANQCLAGGAVELEREAWPAKRKCEECVIVQFGKLEMQLPRTLVGKILVTGTGDYGLHILPRAGASKDSVVFLAVPADKLMQRYEQIGLLRGLDITTNEQLFDALGRLPHDNKALATLRRIEGIDRASRYIKASRDTVHAYWVLSPSSGGSQHVHFVIDGEELVYTLAGNVTRELYEAVLSNLDIAELP